MTPRPPRRPQRGQGRNCWPKASQSESSGQSSGHFDIFDVDLGWSGSRAMETDPTDPIGFYVRPAKCRNYAQGARAKCHGRMTVKGRRYRCHASDLFTMTIYDLWPFLHFLPWSNRVWKLWVFREFQHAGGWMLGGVFRKLDATLHNFVSSQAALASSTASTSLARGNLAGEKHSTSTGWVHEALPLVFGHSIATLLFHPSDGSCPSPHVVSEKIVAKKSFEMCLMCPFVIFHNIV